MHKDGESPNKPIGRLQVSFFSRIEETMSVQQKAEVKRLIRFYESRGWDWSLPLEFTIRNFHNSLPWQENGWNYWKRRAGEVKP